MADTSRQFDAVAAACRDIFSKKLHDYGAAWRILRPTSVTDQMLIKAHRIRTLEIKGTSRVPEGIKPEFQGLVNYGAIGLIQLERGYAGCADMTEEEALAAYDEKVAMAKSLMLDKNSDYDEIWRQMRVSSYTDLILTKLNRTKQMEDLDGNTLISEGVDANYLDMMNYALFGLIRLEYD
ncbi:MAG: DUF1599 domain-containing protein [Bacteroidales bacterium]|jgi:hypothetical protein|nr:DUF1599 domain-containing protein [Bacteroidales bacterium]